MNANGPIQPILLRDTVKALQVSAALQAAQIHITSIRPPTVPEGTARLRITLSAAHELNHVDQLLDVLVKLL